MRLTTLACCLGTGLDGSMLRTSVLTPPAKSSMAFTHAAAVGVLSTTSLMRCREIRPDASPLVCSGYGCPQIGLTARAYPDMVPRASRFGVGRGWTTFLIALVSLLSGMKT